MANAMYTKGRAAFLDGQISWANDTIRAMLLTSAYTVNLGTHQYLSDVAGQMVASAALTTKTSTGGAAGADPAVFTAVLAALGVGTQAIVYKDTGTAATSRLICHHDTITGFPVTPNGGDIRIDWYNGVVFTL